MVKTIDFFMERIEKQMLHQELGECWIWQLSCDGAGRPAYCDRSLKSHNQLASRGLWRLVKNKDLSSKMTLNHTCDEYKCINPEHLYEGTSAQNRKDAVDRQRIPPRKINKHIDEIVKLFKEGIEQQEIAKKVGVSRITIQRFLNGQMNQYIHNYVKEAEENRNAKIKQLYEEGKCVTAIMKELNISQTVVYSIVPEIKKYTQIRTKIE